MDKKVRTVYLVGKANGSKWDMISASDVDRERWKFVSSDNEGADKHDFHVGGISDLAWCRCVPRCRTTQPRIKKRVTEQIRTCHEVLALLDRPDSYGSIAEIAYASALGKVCTVIIIVGFPVDVSLANLSPEQYKFHQKMWDAYWLVTHFPGVTTVIVETFKEAVAQLLGPLPRPRTLSRKERYHEYLRSPMWKKRRTAAVKRAGNACQLCNSNGKLHVHHRTYERVGNEKAADLIALCADCHAKFHDKLPAVGA